MSFDNKSSGIDIEASYKSEELIKENVKNTFNKKILTGLGGFGSLFSIQKAKEMYEPILVSGTDGVGTKLKIAFILDKHDTIGIDCVAMCVNHIVCSGAEPLFFMDYISCGKNVPEKIREIISGVTKGCNMCNTSLVGAETAEMSGLYDETEYDIAGFSVGIVDKKNIIDGTKIKATDVIIGIASNGLHSNGYSLVRKVLRPSEKNINEYIEKLGMTLGEELIKPTKIYANIILDIIKKIEIKGICHIASGGFIENIPRILKEGLGVKINKNSWPILPIFEIIQKTGEISDKNMYNTFNMGIGMVVIVDKKYKEATIKAIELLGEKAYCIGEVIEGTGFNF